MTDFICHSIRGLGREICYHWETTTSCNFVSSCLCGV